MNEFKCLVCSAMNPDPGYTGSVTCKCGAVYSYDEGISIQALPLFGELNLSELKEIGGTISRKCHNKVEKVWDLIQELREETNPDDDLDFVWSHLQHELETVGHAKEATDESI